MISFENIKCVPWDANIAGARVTWWAGCQASTLGDASESAALLPWTGVSGERLLWCIFMDLLVQTEKHTGLLMQQILFPIQIWKSVKHDNINSEIYDLP